LPTITDDVSIVGPGADVLTLNASGSGYRHFEVNDGGASSFIDVLISGLTLTGGDVSAVADGEGRIGGAIKNHENLTIANSTLDSNSAFVGGAIGNRSGGTLNIVGSTLSNNSAVFAGGAIHISGTETNVLNSTISGNDADNRGGAIYQYAGSGLVDDLTIQHSTFKDNDATSVNTAIHSTGVGTKSITLDNSIISGVIDNGNVVGDFNILGSSDPGFTGANNLFNRDSCFVDRESGSQCG
jgi:hypothetical protein